MGDARTGRIEWYRPPVRVVLPLGEVHCSRRLARTIRSGRFEISTDRAFEDVIDACADRPDTWITPPVRDAYVALHREGDAHSVEAWSEGRLAGGVYGVRLGGAFMAESMFHRETDAGKVALMALVRHLDARGFRLLDVQMKTRVTASFGAIEFADEEYLARLRKAMRADPGWGPWTPP